MIIIHTIIEACVCWPEKVRVYVGQRKWCVCWPEKVRVYVDQRKCVCMLARESACVCWPEKVRVYVGQRKCVGMLARESARVCWPEKVRVYVGQRKYHVHKICNTRFDLTCPLTLNFNTSAHIIYPL